MSNTYQFQAFYTANNFCVDISLQRIDLVPQACNPTSFHNRTEILSGTAACANSTIPNYDVITGCIEYANITTVGDHLWQTPDDLTRVQFSSYADYGCNGYPSLVSEFLMSTSDCVDNVQTLDVTLINNGSSVPYSAERMTLDFATNTIYRTYFDPVFQDCRVPLQSLDFTSQNTCFHKQKVHRINDFGISLSTLYTAGDCTQPADISATIATSKTGCEPQACSSETGFTAASCVAATKTIADTTSAMILGPFATLSHFLDEDCSIPYFTESLRPGFCQHVSRNSSFNILLNADGTVIANSFGGSKNCTGIAKTTNYTVGSCHSKFKVVAVGKGSISSSGITMGVVVAISVGCVCALALVGLAIWVHYRNKQAYLKNQLSSGSLNKANRASPLAGSVEGKFFSPVNLNHTNSSQKLVVSPTQLDEELEVFSVLHPEKPSLVDISKPIIPSESTEKENALFRGMTVFTTFKQLEASDSSPLVSYDGNPRIFNGDSSSYAQNPQQWSIPEVADWISQNGGTAGPVYEQSIDGKELMLRDVENLFTVLKITAVGKRVQFSIALESLKAPPPSYLD
ncbi:UNVERIFIED_CONTAM: hypothetical protein HDU68_009535 [Siphonaria sp. JEL0065]|nr:hypothetical protein HDU68_009535 [Siphonaria sp. JEL0065]